jgi:large subunit ribosomal protein L24
MKRFAPKFKIKKGDNVVVISGDDKGKKGIVKSVDVDAAKVLVEGVNMIKRHTKPSAAYPDGGIIEKEAPLHISNVSLIDPKSGKATRVSIKKEGKKIIRISKKSNTAI